MNYNDDRQAVEYAIMDKKHVFVFNDFNEGTATIREIPEELMTDVLLGLMNEIIILRKFETLDKQNITEHLNK